MSIRQHVGVLGLIIGLTGETSLKRYMKSLIEVITKFVRKEWFLLVAMVAIAMIVLLFELI